MRPPPAEGSPHITSHPTTDKCGRSNCGGGEPRHTRSPDLPLSLSLHHMFPPSSPFANVYSAPTLFPPTYMIHQRLVGLKGLVEVLADGHCTLLLLNRLHVLACTVLALFMCTSAHAWDGNTIDMVMPTHLSVS